ncbi:MAG: calcium-translocating P-type ATPase, PMCA-type [Rhodocyclaceae bacterium]|nr:calcium-translocating P-type ATPase, PMCA-type [Rhodocyclaceae bacterium]MBK6675530.1 calcium-translocating P-type ATPase, PMCA-type [Rhodocyclaceae bacterium]MBK9312082.1 calcium-translocating P-type ATPase, PMCA-type [Rhodocyclaceae bacterium]MBK9956256.1 calcium-translocating P-type ATPase, PMCA-type [Rhodocyclaceae bacterium]
MTIPRRNPSWHALAAETVVSELDSAPREGLSAVEVAARLASQGANRLAEKPRRPVWRKFLDQFRGLLVLILLAAAVLAGAVGDVKDAVVIFIVVLLNATLGFIQEHRAENALAALKNMLAPSARVRRGGSVGLVEAAELVPGDIVLLEAGDRVPADARVLLAHAAEVAEAALTGESQPVAKTPEAVDEKSVLAERRGMVFMNTVVTRGRLEAVVVATGMATEMGRLAWLLAEAAESATPLQVQLDALGKRLAAIAVAVVGLMFVAGLWRGDDLARTAMTAIALAVAAIPEGLPAVVTVTLALGMHRMARRNAIVKRLAAVETLGCTTVICSDKTGTLTLNRMTARSLYCAGRRHPTGEDVPVGRDLGAWLMPAALCNDARMRDGDLIGDPTEGALLTLAAKAGLDAERLTEKTPRIAEIPFDSAHKFMATFHHDGEVVRMWLKGAPDVLLARAGRWLGEAREQALDGTARAAFVAENEALAGEALRVLALAKRDIAAHDFDPAGDLMAWANDLTLTALVGIIDPPRPEAKEAIRVCREAGVEVKMITGDHPVTAAAIARDLGLEGEVHEGSALDGLDAPALAALVERSAVFARVAPEHKMRIIDSLKSQGHVVAMTGDGVNDAPALKTADIGVAMGITGTEVTKEAATLVLTDDNFATIVRAVKEGRTIYDNIVKFVRFQLSTNIGAIFTVLGAPVFGFATPFTAIQILWVNIIMDGPPAMTLGVEPARPGIMRQPPRAAAAAILSWQRMWRIALYGLTMAAGTLAVYAWGLTTPGEVATANTLAFTTFVLFQFFNIFNARAEHGSAFNRQFFSNGKLWLALAAVLGLQVVAVHWAPAQAVFDTVDLTALEWAIAVLVASTTLWLEELRKLLVRVIRR